MNNKQKIENDGVFSLNIGGSSLKEEALKRIELLKETPKIGHELFQAIVEDGALFQLQKLKHKIPRWVAVDGSNSYHAHQLVLDVYFDVSAAAVLNPREFQFSTLDFYQGYPTRIPRFQFTSRFPSLIRDCTEYSAIISILENLNIDILFGDGSIIAGANWYLRRHEGIQSEGSLSTDLSYFVDVIDKELLPRYYKVVELAKRVPIVFSPKSSLSQGLLRMYTPNLIKKPTENRNISDVFILSGWIEEGQYIVPNSSINSQISGGVTSKFREIINQFTTVIFQAGNPRYCLPLRFELHKKWIDKLPQILNLIRLLYDPKLQLIGPLAKADEVARNLTRNTIGDFMEFLMFKELIKYCDNDDEKILLVKMFSPYRFDRNYN